MTIRFARRLSTASLVLLIALRTDAQNTCATALQIVPGTHSVPGFTGTEIPVSVCTSSMGMASSAMWYRYTPTANVSATVSSAISSTDTRLHIFSGDCGSLLCVAGDDDSGPGGSSVAMFNTQAGTPYTIVFDDQRSSAAFDFQLAEGPPIDQQVDPVVFTSAALPAGLGAVYTVVDMDGDHLDDLVSIGSTFVKTAKQQPDGSFILQNTSFPSVANSPGTAIAAGDMDNNGYTDLLFGGGAATILIASDDGSTFQEWSSETYLFVQRTNMADIDNDGFLDGFYCHDVGINHYYFSDGQGGFTEGSGELSVIGGNYASIWIDFDNDGDVDMFNTKCGGGSIDELYRNDGGGQYTNVAPEMGLADTHNAWSSAWGDFDNDGDMDAFIGKSGSPFHKLMRNDGTIFTNITIGSGAEVASSSVDWRTHDFNNDGYLDIIGQSEILYNAGNMQFALATNVPFGGPIGDVDDDGFLDIVSGSALYENNGNSNHWLTVSLVGTVSNRMGVGARVTVTTAQGQQIRDIVSGDGTKYMSTLNAHFGLGEVDAIQQVEVHWPSGIVDVIAAPAIDQGLVVVEGLSTGMVPVEKEVGLRIRPNPARDKIVLQDMRSDPPNAVITDMAGRAVLIPRFRGNTVDISGLSSGTYVITVHDGDERKRGSFVKE